VRGVAWRGVLMGRRDLGCVRACVTRKREREKEKEKEKERKTDSAWPIARACLPA
jgi:hypothetical protein